MRRTGILGFVAVAMLLGACSPSGSGSGGDLAGKVWTVSSVKANRPSAKEVLADPNKPWTIEFRADGTFTATADCNVTGGTYDKTPTGDLTLHAGETKSEGCPSGALVSPFIPVISRATKFAIADGTLTVTVEDGSVISLR